MTKWLSSRPIPASAAWENNLTDMPQLYEYFGLVVLFYSNEYEPVHVHGICQGQECRADFTIVDGKVVEIAYRPIKGRRPLELAQMADLKVLVECYADKIVQKWVDYFVLHKAIQPQRIDRKIK